MKKIIPICFLIYLTSGCFSNFKPDEPSNPKPNKKEQNIKDSLQKLGYSNINFEIPYVGLSPYGQSIYYFQLNFPIITSKNINLDSIIMLNRNIAFDLYAHAIADSIIYDLESIKIIFILRTKNKKGYSSINKNYEKKMLIDSTGIKIIKTHNKYERLNLFKLKQN
jgi:hypothetical protein